MSFTYQPLYKLIIARINPEGTRITSLRQVTSLQSLQCNLTTDTTMGTLTATWADTDMSTFGSTPTRPTPMCLIQLQLTNKQGQWGIAWTGLADSIARTVNFGQTKVYTLQASSPYKLFNITTQTAAATLGFAMDYAAGIKGTALLGYAAQQCNYPGPFGLLPAATGWNYTTALNGPGTKGTIDYSTDVGIDTYGAISASMYLSPAQQTYSSILQGLVADTELEFFFNEMGQLIWRPLAYLNVPGNNPTAVSQANLQSTLGGIQQRVPIVQKDSIINHTFTETDQGVLTTVYVRYYVLQTLLQQGVWNAPSAMAQALQPRIMVFYAPWIQDKGSANNLANALGLRYSGNMHTADLVMIADPTITVGTTIRVPKFPDLMPQDNTVQKLPTQLNVQETPWYYYYVYGITYNLQIGGLWTMELDLRYGRDETLAFPYLNYSPYLQDRQVATGSLLSRLTFPQLDTNPANPYQITTPFSTQVDTSLAANTLEVDSTKIAPGTEVMVKDKAGKVIGKYITVAPPTGTTLGNVVVFPNDPASTAGVSQVYLTINVPGIISDVTGGTLNSSNPNAGYTNSAGGVNGSGDTTVGTVVQGDHVSQIHGNTKNMDCGPASVVRYLRNRSRRGQTGLPISGDKWSQIQAVAATIPDIDTNGSNFSQLGSYMLGFGVTGTYTSDWTTVLKWSGEVLLSIDQQPVKTDGTLAWPPSFDESIASTFHVILWMKDLYPGTLFNDPLAHDPNTGAEADVMYSQASVKAGFLGALLLP